MNHFVIIKANGFTDDHGNVLFDPKNRKGSERLKKAGYVERPEYKQAGQKGKGYFCSTCEYMKKKSGAKNGVVCVELGGAEDAPWGCCNLWELKPNATD